MGTSSETATYVGGFSSTAASNKPDDSGADGKRANGAAEIRQLKKIIKDSFPNVTGAVTASHTELNQLDGVTVGGTSSGDVVTTDDTQTLTNKTLSDPTLSLTSGLDIDGTLHSSWDATDTDIDGLIGGSTNGSLIESTSQAHLTIGLRSNDLSDGFQVISKEAGNANYSLLCLNVKASGEVSVPVKLGVGETSPDYKLDVNGAIGFTPGASVTPVDNGDVVFELTNNTTLTIKAKGSDSTVRTATITLA